ncbi:MAG: intermembrane transport protein PqiB, partial [Gammaproteobacteria bacterium]
MTEATVVDKGKKISPIWVVPIVAAILGIWVVAHAYSTRGPLVAITFDTADGIEVGKTKIKLRAVELGLVEGIELTEGMNGVTVHARLDREARDLLREDTQFWVVRPRLGPAGISGMGTLLSGAYIEISPGIGESGMREYRGQDDIPVTPPTTPGLHVVLTAPNAATLRPGNPVMYRGYTVGRVESAELDTETGHGRYGVFVKAPYHGLVTSNTRFWNSSGISMDMHAGGLSVKTESIEAMLVGGVSFDLPEDAEPGIAVDKYAEFELFPDHKSINTHPFVHHKDYVLLFDTSVRGLVKGAPVQYRGIQVGTVRSVSFDHVSDDTTLGPDGHIRIPVLIRLDPARINLPDTTEGASEFAHIMETSVASGLRASLKSGSLVTGRLFVALDFFDDVEPATIDVGDGYHIFPTESSGLEQIEHKISSLLDKLQQLPLDSTLASTKGALDEIAKAAAAGNSTLEDLDTIL